MPTFVENWFTDESCATLATLVRSVEHIPGRIVELGSWEGRSTLAIANATTRPVHAVDTWEGAASDKYQRDEIATGRDVFAQWCANLKGYDHVRAHPMDWHQYAAHDDAPVALVFIDADHTYHDVSEQIKAFRPLMSPGGIISGDDYPMRAVRRAVRTWLENVTIEGRVWSWRSA